MKSFCALISLPFLLCSQPQKVLAEWKKDPALKNASFAFSVIDAQTGAVLAEHNSQQTLIPASTQKIFATAAALQLKGKQHLYETKICFAGRLNAETGVLNGDILVIGSSDPSIQSSYFGKNQITDVWAEAISKFGIKKINGSIIVNGGAMPRQVPSTWLWEDVSNYFGANACGFNYMDNKFSIVFKSAEAGKATQIISTTPNYLCCPYNLSNTVISDGRKDEAYVYGDPFSFSRRIEGSIPVKKEHYDIEASLPDPALLCAEHLLISLQKINVVCSNGAKSDYELMLDPKILTIVYKHFSPELEKLVFFTNQYSNNMYCEAIAQSMVNTVGESPLYKIRSYLASKDIDTMQVFMKDACGLSRLNSCSALSQALLLKSIFNNKQIYDAFNASLPVSGKMGTMSNIGKGTLIENNLRAKSGYLERVRAYCGFVKSKSGKNLAFSVILNNYNCSAREAKLKLEKFLVALAEL